MGGIPQPCSQSRSQLHSHSQSQLCLGAALEAQPEKGVGSCSQDSVTPVRTRTDLPWDSAEASGVFFSKCRPMQTTVQAQRCLFLRDPPGRVSPASSKGLGHPGFPQLLGLTSQYLVALHGGIITLRGVSGNLPAACPAVGSVLHSSIDV